jgi:nucleotide-binding universal stress UspA family protein
MAPPTIQRILVPTDFGPAAASALEWAMTLGRKFDASIRLFHACVIPPVTYTDLVTWPVGPLEDAARNAMEKLVRSTDYPKLDGHVFMGTGAADEILKHAEEFKPELVVMGTHARKGITRLFLGSVAENVLRHAHIPVLTISVATD